MKNKKYILLILVIIMLGILTGCGNSSNDEVYRIRFKELVDLDDLKKYNNKTVEAVGFLSTIGAYDGSFTYLMNLPYQACPYCNPQDNKITNTLAIFAKKGSEFKYTESAVIVTGTLKLEKYVDEFGYSYDCRLVDAKITNADSSIVGDKFTLYNEIADRQILINLLDVLDVLYSDIYYEDIIAEGYEPYDRIPVDISVVEQTIKELKELDREEYNLLLDTANILMDIGSRSNELIQNKEYSKLENYKEKLEECYDNVNMWMSEYEL